MLIYHEIATHENVTILTADGVRGFAWFDENGYHKEDGFVFPEIRMVKGTVQELVSENGERSAAWTETGKDM